MAANIIQIMKQTVKAQVLAISTLHAFGGTGAAEADVNAVEAIGAIPLVCK
jgi:hypothetical protein